MANDQMTIQEFGATVKAKYPAYKDKSDEEIGRAVIAKYPQYKDRIKPTAAVSASPSPYSPAGLKEKALTARDWLVDQLPAAGGLVGGMVGGATGLEAGPGAIIPAAVGAAAGGGLGEDVRQTLTEKFHPEDKKMGALESGARMVGQAGLQGANEVGGRLVGRGVSKLLRPVAEKIPALKKYPILDKLFAVGEGRGPKSAEHLTAAAANKDKQGVAYKAISNTIDDIGQEVEKLPPDQRNVKGFLNAVNSRKTNMNNESAAAMMPIRGVQTVPRGISRNIRSLVRDYMDQTPAGRANKKYLENQALLYDKPWTFGQLDQLRTDLSSQLAKHNVRGSVARYTAQKGDLDLAVDNAILDGLRETVYPEMDSSAGKSAKYFETMKGRQSSLITLQELLEKRVEDLGGKEAASKATSPFSKENVSIYAHAGGMPRAYIHGIKEAVSPTRELQEAGKHVSKAFPAVYSQPWENLFTTTARVEESKPPKKRVAAALTP